MVFCAVLASALVLAFTSTDERYVLGPGLACIVMVHWLWMTLWDRDQKIPFFDVGFFCALATLVYTVYPLFNYWMDGMQFGPLADNRLRAMNPSPAELGEFHIRHVLYLLSFIAFYSTFRGKGTIEIGKICTTGPAAWQVIFFCFLLLSGYFYILQLTTGADFNASYDPKLYASNLAAYVSMPLLLLQISVKLRGVQFVFKFALLFFVVSRCRQKQWLIFLLLWISAEVLLTVFVKGARSQLVFFVFATVLFYHRMIKPLTIKFLITSGAAFLLVFIFLGLYRAYNNLDELSSALNLSGSGIFSATNEFQSLLGTAYDVYRLKQSGIDLPWYLYFNDIMPILPPHQFLPFEKIVASEWYLSVIGLSGTGQGYMWGVISQSIVGLDWLELAVRGAILGYILARFHRWYLKHQSGFLETLVYVFFCIKIYYTFRDTTFSFLTNFVWEIIPFYILLRVGVGILPKKTANQSGPSPCLPSK